MACGLTLWRCAAYALDNGTAASSDAIVMILVVKLRMVAPPFNGKTGMDIAFRTRAIRSVVSR
jgi:hypothetical protein